MSDSVVWTAEKIDDQLNFQRLEESIIFQIKISLTVSENESEPAKS